MPKRGDKKSGKMFWAYAKSAKNGEYWVTPEKFDILESNRKLREERDRKKRAERMRELRLINPKYFYMPTTERKKKDAARYQRNKKKIQEYQKRRLQENPQARLAQNMRTRLALALKGIAKGAKSLRLFGCDSWEQLINHLESKFKNGMTWNNYGTYWHVDHIMPCASFDLSNPSHKERCFHYTNLQPLKASDNFRKNKTFPSKHQFQLL